MTALPERASRLAAADVPGACAASGRPGTGG